MFIKGERKIKNIEKLQEILKREKKRQCCDKAFPNLIGGSIDLEKTCKFCNITERVLSLL